MAKIFDYFDGRYRESVLSKPSAEDGPVITISRLTGCDGREVADNLVAELNKRDPQGRWRWIDKDIIYAIARELNTDAERVEHFYKGYELSDLSEMIMAFSGGFVSDLRVKKAIREIVMSICKEGYAVLVGRGGVSIAKDIADALHIRIVAPFYWRVQNVMKKREMGIETAEQYVIDTDQKRHNLINAFLDKKSVNHESLFDAMVNRGSFTISETADLIVSMYEKKIIRQILERKKPGIFH
ncbi:MAG: cytidylate kinase-like family protein [Bacteroidales bacterium]